ncbi:hypothetical protein [Nostoc sp.]
MTAVGTPATHYLAVGKGNPVKAKDKLGWQAKYKMKQVVQMMVEAKLSQS